MWMIYAVLSALLLGIYDLFKKSSLNENAVMPVLFFSTLTSGLLFVPFLWISKFSPALSGEFWYIPSQNLNAHIHFFIKSVIVGSSWLLAYFAMKHLPITVVTPIRSSGPVWTLFGAILIFGETMNWIQWAGLLVTIGFYYLFSLSGKKEGFSFRENRWIMFMILATIIGSVSSLYDKYLVAHFNRMAMQSWFSIYMVPVTGALLLFIWIPNRARYVAFEWRWSIILIGISLTVADFLYFRALSFQGSLIALVSTVRRGSVIVSFFLGAAIFREKNVKQKALILFGILAGIGLIVWGS